MAFFVSTPEQAAKIAPIRGELPALQHVIVFADGPMPGVESASLELEAKGAAGDDAAALARYRADALAVRPDDLATIIYTSGTTGEPKGVMLTHDNITSNVVAVQAVIPFRPDDIALSFLPLSHIFERMFDYLMFSVGRVDRVRGIDRHGAAEHRRGAAHARRVGAAPLREDVRPRAGECARGRAP